MAWAASSLRNDNIQVARDDNGAGIVLADFAHYVVFFGISK